MRRFAFTLLFLGTLGCLSAQQVYTLEDCRTMANTHNKDLLIAKERVSAANSMKKAAFTQYLPNISASGAYSWNEKEISLLSDEQKSTLSNMGTTVQSTAQNVLQNLIASSSDPATAASLFGPLANMDLSGPINNMGSSLVDAFRTDTRNVYAGAILLTQPIFMGGKIKEMNRMASYAKNLAESQFDSKKIETIYKTDEAYWRVVSLANKLKLATSYVQLLQKMDSDVQKSVAIGVATKADELSVKVKLNEAEMTLVQVENGLSLSKMALCQQCGLSLESNFSLADESIEPKEQLLEEQKINMQEAIDNRHEIRSLQQALNIAESNRRLQVSRFMPTVGLTAGYIVSNPSCFNGFKNEFDGFWQVGIAVNVPIFHFGERIHTLNAAKSERNIAQYQLDNAKELVELDITQANQRVTEARRRETMTITNQERADENLRYATLSFEEGVAAPSILLEAQTAWLKAHSDAIDAMIETKMCETYMKKAIGEIN